MDIQPVRVVVTGHDADGQACVTSDSPANDVGIDMEPVAQVGDQRLDVLLGQLDNQVHIQGRPGLTTDRARQRAANEVTHATGLQGLGDDQSDANRVGDQSQRPRRRAACG